MVPMGLVSTCMFVCINKIYRKCWAHLNCLLYKNLFCMKKEDIMHRHDDQFSVRHGCVWLNISPPWTKSGATQIVNET